MTRSPVVRILWVDDEIEDHKEDAKNLETAQEGLKIIIIHPNQLLDLFNDMSEKERIPDLSILDYFLDQVESGDQGKYKQRGLSAAGVIREMDPEQPIYVVTQQNRKVDGIFYSGSRAAIFTFDRILTFKELQRNGHNILFNDAIDHRKIRQSPRRNVNSMIDLLKAPMDDYNKIKMVLPEELRYGLSPRRGRLSPDGNAISFSRWVNREFLITPGFLYNQLYVSTYLGMTTDYFNKIATRFKKAQYQGVFSNTLPPLWWASEVRSIIFSNPKSHKISQTNIWEVAPILFKIPKSEFSRCAVCNDILPETVGTNVHDDLDARPVHYRCSQPHPNKRKVSYFDEQRSFEI